MILWLVGMMGSGKSSAGRQAAESLGVYYGDTDDFVVERMGCSIAQLWGERGEGAFRDIEKVAMNHMSSGTGIVSTGGGVVLSDDNRRLMAGDKVVWLEAAPAVLAKRLEDTGQRPGLASTSADAITFLHETLEERRSLYESVATHRIDTTNMTIADVARQIEGVWRD